MEGGGMGGIFLSPWALSKLGEIYDTTIILDIVKSEPCFNYLSTNLVASVLNYTDLRDTLNVMRVCKKWYDASRLQHFWRQRILYALKKHCELFDHTQYNFLEKHFDVFVMKEMPFKHQLEWIFRQNRFNFIFKRGYFEEGRYLARCWFNNTNHYDKYQWQFYYNDKTCRYRFTYLEKNLNGIEIHRMFGFNLGCIYISNISQNPNSAKIVYLTEEGHKFEGNAILGQNHEYIPHGAGKWNFVDGTTLTGNNVAFAGVPHGNGKDGEDSYFAGENKKRKIG